MENCNSFVNPSVRRVQKTFKKHRNWWNLHNKHDKYTIKYETKQSQNFTSIIGNFSLKHYLPKRGIL